MNKYIIMLLALLNGIALQAMDYTELSDYVFQGPPVILNTNVFASEQTEDKEPNVMAFSITDAQFKEKESARVKQAREEYEAANRMGEGLAGQLENLKSNPNASQSDYEEISRRIEQASEAAKKKHELYQELKRQDSPDKDNSLNSSTFQDLGNRGSQFSDDGAPLPNPFYEPSIPKSNGQATPIACGQDADEDHRTATELGERKTGDTEKPKFEKPTTPPSQQHQQQHKLQRFIWNYKYPIIVSIVVASIAGFVLYKQGQADQDKLETVQE